LACPRFPATVSSRICQQSVMPSAIAWPMASSTRPTA
jgi:hypothetical protein